MRLSDMLTKEEPKVEALDELPIAEDPEEIVDKQIDLVDNGETQEIIKTDEENDAAELAAEIAHLTSIGNPKQTPAENIQNVDIDIDIQNELDAMKALVS